MLPTYVGHGRGVNADFWYYLWMRDLIELAWNNAIDTSARAWSESTASSRACL